MNLSGSADVALPSVTVSLLAFHTRETIQQCVASCLSQEYDGDVEVIVREQGDDAEEARLVAALAENAPRSRPVTLERGRNIGFSAGHNRSIERTDRDLVLVLNADAWLRPDFLAEAAPVFDAPDVAAVQGKLLRPDGTIDAVGLTARRSRRFETRGHGAPDDGTFDEEVDVFGADGAAALYRRDALDDAATPGAAFGRKDGVREWFDESFFAYKEDVDLAWRLQWRAWRTVYRPSVCGVHDRSASTTAGASPRRAARERLQIDRERRRLGFVNQRLVQVKNDDGYALLRDVVPWIGREVLAWGFGAVTDAGLVAAVARLRRLLPEARLKRRWIREHRHPGADPYRFFVS